MAIISIQRAEQTGTQFQDADKPTDGVFEITSPAAEPLFTRQSVLCVVLLGACLLATWPVAEVGINDDWSYIRTTQLFAQTGHFVYNGWGSMLLGWLVLWGALFVRLFGLSFTTVRMAVIPIDLATALFYHAVMRRFGLNKSHATFATLTLVLSPLFLPLGTTFMTDVPGFFPIVLCVYFCQLALSASSDRAAQGWLITAACTNIALGTVRQTAWLGVLIIVPCCGWILRRRRFVVPLTVGLWLVGILCIQLAISWFARQPYSAPDNAWNHHLDLPAFEKLLRDGLGGVLTGLLLLLPALATGLPAPFPLRRRAALRGGLLGLLFLSVVAVLKHYHRSAALGPPWLGTTIDYTGLQVTTALVSPRFAPTTGMLIFVLCCLLCVWAFAETLALRPRPEGPLQRGVHWRVAFVLLVPFLLIYSLLLIPRATFVVLFDRYLLIIVAVALLYVLGWHQERVSARVPGVAILILILFAWVGVASTHDVFARERARVRLLDELEQAGIPRTSIRGGFAFDGTTQIEAEGYVNEPKIVNPPGAYHPGPIETGPCAYYFDPYVPAIHARYAAETGATDCVAPSSFAPVPYRMWLPLRTAYVWAGILPDGGR